MASEWIKVEKITARKPEVLRIAAALKIHPDHAFGLCIRFWFWCDDHLLSGNAAGVTTDDVDLLLDRSGFAEALISVGWLRVREGSLEVPNFDRHLSQSSKTRALTAARVAEHKRKGNEKLTPPALAERYQIREEEEKKNKAHPPSLAEVVAYCDEIKSSESPNRFFDEYAASGWKDGRGNPIVDWKAKFRAWGTNGHKPSRPSGSPRPPKVDPAELARNL